MRTANVTGSDLSFNAVSQRLLTMRYTTSSSKKICTGTVQRTANFLGSLALVVFTNFRRLDSALFAIMVFPIKEGKRMKE